ncbi:MAG: hypothetical protein HYV09_32720 [Deltaproteobacteria bacterium]|nr:hypothetical protein [Deltaproteobacteria bacterium]
MANYPPPPPGGGWAPPGGAPDPYAAERALAEFAQARGFQMSPHGDVRWYQAWQPFAYLPPISRVGREVRAQIGEASLAVAECLESDPLKEATGEHRKVVSFLMSPRLAYRAAVRSKGGAGVIDDVTKGLDDLFGSRKPKGYLGDPTFEGRYDVVGPTVEEANAALPTPLRHLLLQGNFRGILEVRAQGLVVTFFDRTSFDPATLDGTIAWVGQIYQAATQYPHVVTPR